MAEGTFLTFGGAIILSSAYFKTKEMSMTDEKDNSDENSIGYDDIKLNYNKSVYSNNFVMLHIDNLSTDIGLLKAKLEKCTENNISVGLVLDSKTDTLEQVYTGIDFLQAIIKEYNIDFPIYFNIDNVMNNENLNNAQKETIISTFLDKTSRSDMYIGLYGTDTNLYNCNEYIIDISQYDTYLVQDSKDIKYNKTHTITKDLNGNIKSSLDLANIINNKKLNSAEKLVLSATYKVKENDSYESLALQFGISVSDLKKYNDNGMNYELQQGDIIAIPNLYKSISKENNDISYNYAIARGIDISDYQINIDWDKVKETSEYVIIEAARNNADYKNNPGEFLNTFSEQFSEAINRDLDVGIYFCISKGMNIKIYEERLENYLQQIDDIISNKNISVNKEDIPVFFDFEVYYQYNDYYRLMNKAEEVCNKHGYNKIGLYANAHTLEKINSQMFNEYQINLNDTNWFVWKSGGKQYSAEEYSDNDDITLDELKEVENKSTSFYTPAIQKVTNVCTDTGATNGLNHCDVSFLYDSSVFEETIEQYDETESFGTIELDLNNYKGLSPYSIINTVQLGLGVAYACLATKVIGTKLYILCTNKKEDKNYTKKL